MGYQFKLEVLGLEKVKAQLREVIRRAEGQKLIQEFVDSVRDYWMDSIRKQSFKVRPLSSDYAAYKAKKGLDPRVFIATGGYLDSTTTGKIPDRLAWYFSTDPKYELLAAWLEFGTSRMPPRPHWRPTLAWAEQQWRTMPKKFGELILKGI